jgi:peroxiredoxin
MPDGEFTSKMGMLVKKNNLGFGDRSWRYSMFVDDGIIKKMFVEPGFSDNCPNDPFEVSDAQTMLDYLQANK